MHLKNLGQRLYVKISEVVIKEIEEVTEEDCISYIRNLVIDRTFDGYIREQETVYGRLERMLGVPIQPAPDEWDRGYNVDFYIEVGSYYIGLQIKPVTFEQMPDAHKWAAWQKETHQRFQEKYVGKVFMVFSVKKKIQSEDELISEIQQELSRLESLALRNNVK